MRCPTCTTRIPRTAHFCYACFTLRGQTRRSAPTATLPWIARRHGRFLRLLVRSTPVIAALSLVCALTRPVFGGPGIAMQSPLALGPGDAIGVQSPLVVGPASFLTPTRPSDTSGWTVIPADGDGAHLLVADPGHNRIYLVNRAATPVTLFGQTAAGGQTVVIAGTGDAGYRGDDGPATQAVLHEPTHLAQSATGALFIADTGNNAIRQIDEQTGVIVTVAGTGEAGYSGDGGPALQATLNGPRGLAFDSGGNLFVADTGNNAVREVLRAGEMSTLGGPGTPGLLPSLSSPQAVAVTSGGRMLIIAEPYRVLRVDLDHNTMVTVAGTGVAGHDGDGKPATQTVLDGVSDVVSPDQTHTIIAESGTNVVRRLAPLTGTLTIVAGRTQQGGDGGDGGPAIKAGLRSPSGVSVDHAGDIFIADAGNRRIREVDARTGIITTVVGP